MPTAAAPTLPGHDRFSPFACLAGLGVIITLLIAMSHWVGGGTPVTFEMFSTLIASLPLPVSWLAAAIGLGWPLRRWLMPTTNSPIAMQVTLGVAAMLIIDSALGSTGLLTLRPIAWLVIVGGIGLLAWQIAPMASRVRDLALPHWTFWSCAPAIAVLLIAACSAPGWLWATEFGGYDALSYHLQLPREWLASDRVAPLDHNVYSFLPGYVEAAYLHLMALRGREHAMAALIDCQTLHALLTLLAAAMAGALAVRLTSPTDTSKPPSMAIGALAAALYLITPWSIVVGSLGYNEMAVNLLLAGGLLVIFDQPDSPWRLGASVGLIAGAACGAKLTSAGFVIAPLGLLMLLRIAPRAWIRSLMSAAVAGLIALAPWLIRDTLHAGNPVFPFAADVLGLGQWTTEQAQLWHRGHMPDVGLADRVRSLWQQFLVFGLRANPISPEPWKPQWGALPWLGVGGGLIALLGSSHRRPTALMWLALLAQIAFWLMCTHLKSRFLLPTAVPLCALAALGLRSLHDLHSSLAVSRTLNAIIAIALLALSMLPITIYHSEGNGAPAIAVGTIDQQTGDGLLPSDREQLGATLLPAVAVNHLLPADARVLLVGEAAPLYMRLDRIAYNTVWDRGPLSHIMRESHNDPEAWREALRAAGFTHMLVNYTMLDVWERSGWNDPLIARRSVTDFAERTLEPLYDYPNDITLYAIPK